MSPQAKQPEQGSSLTESERYSYLEAMGIQAWQSRLVTEAEQYPVLDPVIEDQPSGDEEAVVNQAKADVATLDWSELQQTVAECQLCELHSSRTNTVFGVGNQNADLLVVGEAPGADEDLKGEPFVGRAGQLLDAMLKAIDLDREQVYIANVLKCRPPNNRNPHVSETLCCDPYLRRQIALIQPRLILALGRIAAHHLLVSQESLGKLRQQVHSFDGVPLLVSYHPAYLLRKPVEKRKSWQDLIKARQLLST